MDICIHMYSYFHKQAFACVVRKADQNEYLIQLFIDFLQLLFSFTEFHQLPADAYLCLYLFCSNRHGSQIMGNISNSQKVLGCFFGWYLKLIDYFPPLFFPNILIVALNLTLAGIPKCCVRTTTCSIARRFLMKVERSYVQLSSGACDISALM